MMQSRDRLRVFAVIASSESGGAERAIASLFKGLDRDRFEVWVACHGTGPMVQEYRHFATRVWPLPLAGVFNVRSAIRLSRLMRATRCDIVHTQLWTADVLGVLASKLARVPVAIANVQGPYFLPIGVTGLRKARREVLSRVFRGIYWCFDGIIAASEFIRDDLIRRPGIRIPSDRVKVIHNALDFQRIERFLAARQNKGEVRGDRGFPLIVTVANFFAIKGHEWLIRGIPRVLRRFPRARFVFVGDGQTRRAMEALVISMGLSDQVVFTGSLANPLELINGSDIFVLPSVSEGLSIAILEAQALGKPVVATRVGGIPEVVEDGETGLLVPPRDPEALADAICTLLENPSRAQAMGERGRRTAQDRFSAETMVRAVERLYLDVALRKDVIRG